ncbi:MAG: NAD-dependent epimerase/dehydratase family protein, partial [Candidatus Omnitrophica bacterium]|nr:NAD-dependent epimerase/dehydratase family protein [Candidatus Omnitrophota bacterium]
MKENVLVTGAAGFIGSHLVRELMKHDGFNVIAIDDLSGGFKENLPENIDFIKVSVNNIDSIKQLFNKYKFKYVYHLAAYAAEGLSPFIRNFNYTNNLLGSVNLINESVNNNIQCFIFTSSIAVYGENQVPMSEDMFPQPKDPYGISKYAVELDLKSAFDNFGLNYIIFRPHNVYGEFQNIGDKYRNVVGIFMNEMLQDKPLTIFGDGEQQRAFSYIGDIINVLAESAWNHKAYNQVFNIGADQPYTVNELAMEVIKAMGKTSHPLAHLKERNEVKVAYSEHSKVKS